MRQLVQRPIEFATADHITRMTFTSTTSMQLLLEDLRAVALDLAESLELRVKKARRP